MFPQDSDVARLDFLDRLVHQKMGRSLTKLQRFILKESWQLSKKTYEEIATPSNYSKRYIQQRVAPELWHVMTQVIGIKVTKSNCRSVIFRYLAEQAALQQAQTKPSQGPHSWPEEGPLEGLSPSSEETDPRSLLALPTESVPLDSPYYIQQSSDEVTCYRIITQPGALIRIKSPRQTGKTSLMNRIIAAAKPYPAVILNFQQVERETLSSVDKLLRWICANTARQLKLRPNLDDYWDEDIGSKMSCTIYLEEFILENIQTPLILAIEESSALLAYSEVAKDFFSMFRTWHEHTKHDGTWQKLRLIIVQSTEAYVPLAVNKSPFNVGFEISLSPFNNDQVSELSKRYGLEIEASGIEQLLTLLAGHPYLTRLALYHLAQRLVTWEALFTLAATDEGIFNDHLHRHLWNLQQSPHLSEAFAQVVNAAATVTIPQKEAFKLQSMGLVTLCENQVQVSCQLYREYFKARL